MDEMSDDVMYNDFGMYSMWYYHTWGFEVRWKVDLNWRMFKSLMDSQDEEYARLMDSLRYNSVLAKIGGLN